MFGFELPHGLGVGKTLAQRINQDGIQAINALAV
jgi:hypothetical protein